MALPKLLVFLRHGPAIERSQFVGDDQERPLTEVGIKRTQRVCCGIARAYKPTRVLASSLVRAKETAQILVFAANPQMTVEICEALQPHGSVASWVKALKGLMPPLTEDDVVAIVGHEPDLGRLIAHHLGFPEPVPLKKAGVAVVAPKTLTSGELVAFVPPKLWPKD